MMKRLSFALMTLLVLFFTGCENEEFAPERSSSDHFTLSYSINGIISVTSRASVPVEPGEDKVNSLYMLFFDKTPDGNGIFAGGIDALKNRSSLTGASGQLDIDLSGHPNLSKEREYNVLFCANFEQLATTSIESIEDLESICSGYTENEVAGMLELDITGKTGDEWTPILSSELPMTARAVKGAGDKNIEIELIRSVSRFDVTNQANGYELVSASIWNAYTSTSLWKNDETDFPGNRTERYYEVKTTDNQIVGKLYGFENFVENPVQNDELTTSLVIGMKNLLTEGIEYFRTNIHPMNKSQKLQRNNVYCSTIKEVLGKGFSSERAAYESDQVLLATDINGWTANIGGNVVYDDDNILALPTSVISLGATGDTRTYNIFTNGPGILVMNTQEIPSDVNITLEGNLLEVAAPASSVEWSGILTFSIGNLRASIRIEQGEYFNHYLNVNFDVKELPAFGYKSGNVSPEIEVTGSGKWIAEMYGSNYMSLGSSANQVTAITGEPNTDFTIRTIAANTTSDVRYCFVVVSLVDAPEVKRALVLQQDIKADEYIRFNPGTLLKVVGKRTLPIKLESNADWTAEITRLIIYDEDGIVTFNNGKTSISGSDDQWLTLNFPNKNNNSLTIVSITATTKGNKKASQTIYWFGDGSGEKPDPDPDPNPEPTSRLFVSNGAGDGNLVNPNSDGYRWYVYGLGENMRNTTKFGKKGTMASTGKDPFEYTSSLNATTIADAQIIQLLSNPSSTLFNRIYNRMQEDPTVFLMITSKDAKTINSILAQFKAKTNTAYGSAVTISNSPSNLRPINAAISQKSIMKYLLNNGPAGSVTASQVTLQSSVGQVGAGLPPAAYPDTFVPIILSTRNNNYCVFGIDPVNRLIIMTDPGIFGAAPNLIAYPSYKNFLNEGSINRRFLDNLTAWIINATGKDGFLKDYQK